MPRYRCEAVLGEDGPFRDRRRVEVLVVADNPLRAQAKAREAAADDYDWPFSLVEVDWVEDAPDE